MCTGFKKNETDKTSPNNNQGFLNTGITIPRYLHLVHHICKVVTRKWNYRVLLSFLAITQLLQFQITN